MKSIGQCGTSTIVLPTTAGPDGRFQDGEPGQESLTATQLVAEFLNSQQEEFANLIFDGLGEEFSDIDDMQLLRAINELIGDILNHANQWSKGQRYAQTALAIDVGAVAWDMEANPHTVLILTEDVTSFTVSNYKAGATYELTLMQDASGNKSCAWPSIVHWPGGKILDVTQAPNSEDLVNFSVRDDNGVPILRAFAGQDFKVVS